MKKTALLFYALSCITGLLEAQQTDLSSLYRYNWQVLNPAAINYTYLEDKRQKYMANAAYRNQWLGFEGSPASYNLRFEYLPESDNIKVGAFAMGDRTGAIGTYSVYGNFAYIIYFSNIDVEQYLSVGLNLGGVQYSVNLDELRFQQDQPSLIEEGVTNQVYADMALGCFYRWKRLNSRAPDDAIFREFYAGFSVPQTFVLDLFKPDDGAFDLDRIQHYYTLAGGVFNVNKAIDLEPSLWLRYVPESTFQTLFANAPFSGDLNVRARFQNKFWIGSGYSTNQLMHFELGFNIGKGEYLNDSKDYLFTLGLAYDAPLGGNNRLPGSLEISLAIGWR